MLQGRNSKKHWSIWKGKWLLLWVAASKSTVFKRSRRTQTHRELKPPHGYPRFTRDANTAPQWAAAASQTEPKHARAYIWETPCCQLLLAKLCCAEVTETKLWTSGINPLLKITGLRSAAFSEISNILHMESKCVPDVRGLSCMCCLHPGSQLSHQSGLLLYLHLDMFISGVLLLSVLLLLF